jgi:hypothetical protein
LTFDYDGVTAVAVDPVSPATVYAAIARRDPNSFQFTVSRVYKSLNGGNSWAQIDAGITDKLIRELAVHPSDPGQLYAATDGDGLLVIEQALEVRWVVPPIGLVAGGTAITVVGYDFRDGATVSLGGIAATEVTVINGSLLTARIGPQPAGRVDVVVNNPGSQTATLAGGFVYAEAIYAAYLPVVVRSR